MSPIKTNEHYLVLDCPDYWLYETEKEAIAKAFEIAKASRFVGEYEIVYKAFKRVEQNGSSTNL